MAYKVLLDYDAIEDAMTAQQHNALANSDEMIAKSDCRRARSNQIDMQYTHTSISISNRRQCFCSAELQNVKHQSAADQWSMIMRGDCIALLDV